MVGNHVNFNCHKFAIMQVDEFSRKVWASVVSRVYLTITLCFHSDSVFFPGTGFVKVVRCLNPLDQHRLEMVNIE